MATLNTDKRAPDPAAKRETRRHSPQMDFTPMVDLGFLLITFFMLSTSLAKPQIMPLVMPEDDGSLQELKESTALTLLLGKEDNIYWYQGRGIDHIDSCSFEELRPLLLQKMDDVEKKFGLQTYQDAKTGGTRQGSQLYVLIKPGQNARYNNLVDALDEMNICRIRYYCILDPNPEEIEQLHLR